MSSNIQTALVESAINIGQLSQEVESRHCGAVVTFSGNVRSHDKGRDVRSLTYEIHPSTAAVLDQVVKEVCARSEIINARVVHRHGEIPIRETALFVAVSAAHRKTALTACSLLVDEIKDHIPIWKHQVFSDGTDEWVNSA